MRGNKDFVVLLFNDFLMMLTRHKALFGPAVEPEPFTSDTQYILYRQPFMLDRLRAKALPEELHGPAVFSLTITNEEKDIPLRTSSVKSRDQWVNTIMESCVQYARLKKQDGRLQRSECMIT